MIGFFKRWQAKRKHEAQLKICREDGHFLKHAGELTPGKMVNGAAVPIGPAEFWIYSCLCGYSEINDVSLRPYRRPFDEGERLKKEASVEKK